MKKPSLRLVNVIPAVWGRIWEKLPKCEYAIPGTKKILQPYLKFGLDKDSSLRTYLLVGFRIAVFERSTLLCEQVIQTPFGWYDIVERGSLKADEEKLISYVMSVADEIKGHLEYIYHTAPWELLYKICHTGCEKAKHLSFGSTEERPIDQKESYKLLHYDVRTHELALRKSIFSDHTLEMLAYEMIKYAADRIQPLSIGSSCPMNKEEINTLHALFRKYIHHEETLAILGKYKEHEAAFYTDVLPKMKDCVDQTILKHLEPTHKDHWKKKYEAEEKETTSILLKIKRIIEEKWWLETAA